MLSPKTVLYLHGFASSPRSRKIELLRPLLQSLDIELDTPDLNVPVSDALNSQQLARLDRAAFRKSRWAQCLDID